MPTVYSVNSLLDSNTGLGNTGTLRYVLNQANANHTGVQNAPDLIQFTTGGTIQVGALTAGAGLPALAANEVAVLDATTAPGYDGIPLLTLDGTLATAGTSVNGLTVSGGSSTVKGFDVIHFSGNGIQLDTNGGDTVLSCYVGITTAGTAAGNGGNGIAINGTSNNTIGSTTAIGSPTGQGGNVLSANTGNGVQLAAGSQFNVLEGNFIGTDVSGAQALGNGQSGVQFVQADHNRIGHNDPVTGVDYFNADQVTPTPNPAWTGIRNSDTAGQYLITGIAGSQGLLFDGTIAGAGSTMTVVYPGAAGPTAVYGPDNRAGNSLGLVGSYNSTAGSSQAVQHGFLFAGTTADLSNPANFRTIDKPGAQFNILHSTMQGLVVGNYDSAADHGLGGLPLGPGHALLFDSTQNTFLADVVFPNSKSNTAYGIWYNGNNRYTICGGYSLGLVNNFDDPQQPLGHGYLVDYDARTSTFSNWASFDYPLGVNFITHFEGISSVEKGIYTLAADSVQAGTGDPVQGSVVTVRRNDDGTFGSAAWVNLQYPGLDPSTHPVSSNSIYGNQVVGAVFGGTSPLPYQATVETGFQLSNVISGNGQSGIELRGANDNQIAMNFIGTDAAGAVDLGNAGNGIWITAGSARNLVGGEVSGGNNPRASPPVFVRPPLGNLISGNDANGVLVNDGATRNQLSGNFVGTVAAGSAPLGNALDGVAVESANANRLIGCLVVNDPFIFYNVIDGNGGNGVRVRNANDTTIQANFLGMGADNTTGVGNALDGLLINGSSANTQFGGVIPLGNVDAGNGGNGVEIADTASGTVCFNTFCGLPAFLVTAVPNKLDGMLITSSGGNNLLRTNVISGNLLNGVHLGGNATDVQLAEDIIGLSTNGAAPLPNGANGVLIDGDAHDNFVGGKQPSVIFQTTIAANGGAGIAILGNARNTQVFHTFIGTEILGLQGFGNQGPGILVGDHAQGTVIGGTGRAEQCLISGNLGGGIRLTDQSTGTLIVGNFIGSDRTGRKAVPNQGNGISITSSANQVGGSAAGAGNVIAFNTQAGVSVTTGTGNGILANSIFGNSAPGIVLAANGNGNQPAPVLNLATQPTAPLVQVRGTLLARANTPFTIGVFASPTSSPAGQGKTFLGTVGATTDAGGRASFVYSGTLPAGAGSFFTATATDPGNNTSAFSAAIARTSLDASTLYVKNLYALLLNRAPDPASAGWVLALNAGVPPVNVVLGFESSTEYLTDQVIALYAHYLNRAPDPVGQQAWLAGLQQGNTLEQVAEGLVSSPEYFRDHGSTNQGLVLGLYHDVLGRVPAPGEAAGWIAVLNAGTPRLTVAVSFLTSFEYRTDLVEAYYSRYLLRPADPVGLFTWVNALQSGLTDQGVLAGILGSREGYRMWSAPTGRG